MAFRAEAVIVFPSSEILWSSLKLKMYKSFPGCEIGEVLPPEHCASLLAGMSSNSPATSKVSGLNLHGHTGNVCDMRYLLTPQVVQ